MNLKDAKLGEQYNCYLNAYGEITVRVCERTIIATVIAVAKEADVIDVVLGWKRDKRPNNALYRGSPLENANPAWNWITKHESYVYILQVHKDGMIVHSKVPGVDATLDGLTCNKCSNFFQYAENNQPDGSFVCWSCRSFS